MTAATKASSAYMRGSRGRGAAAGAADDRDMPAYDGTAALSRKKELAYDLSRFDRRTAVRRVYEQADALPVRPALRRRAVARPGVFTRVSFFAVASFVMVIGLLLLIVYSYVQLSELSEKSTTLKNQYNKLKDDETVMLMASEQRINLKDVEDYAVNKLGMVKPEQDQMIYLDLSGDDHAEVVESPQKDASAFLEGLSHALGGIVSFIN